MIPPPPYLIPPFLSHHPFLINPPPPLLYSSSPHRISSRFLPAPVPDKVKTAINNGDGRFHKHVDQPWEVNLDDTDIETNFMADVEPSTVKNLRKVGGSGYHETCLLPEALDLGCTRIEPIDNSVSGVQDTNSGDFVSQSRHSVHTCHVPGTWADGERIDTAEISACDVVALFGMQSRVYSNASFGFTEADYAACTEKSVPNIVGAYYRYQHGDGERPSSGEILQWWAKNRPSFYHGAVGRPLFLPLTLFPRFPFNSPSFPTGKCARRSRRLFHCWG